MRKKWIKDQAYTKAQEDWVLAEQYLKDPGAYDGQFWLCGEVELRERLYLVGFSEPLSFQDHLKFNGQPVVGLCQTGDKLALWVLKGARGQFVVQDIKLLAPCLKEKSLGVSTSQVQKWSGFIQQVRDFFLKKGFSEQQTPFLVTCPGLEPNPEPFKTQWIFGSSKRDYFLPTSPELHLKKLLCSGLDNIFEIKTCFRNEEQGHHHQPEFTMLEWYRAYKPLGVIKKDLQNLLVYLSQEDLVFKSRSIKELFKTYLNFELSPQTKKNELMLLAQENEICVSRGLSWDDLFHLIFLEKIEKHLSIDGPEFILDFPPSQAALSRLNFKGWAERFELYWKGIEIANAFDELNDPVVQRQRFESDIRQRQQEGKTTLVIDEDFMQFLESGMPPSAGIAVGLERLFMACTGAKSIGNIRPFTHAGI